MPNDPHGIPLKPYTGEKRMYFLNGQPAELHTDQAQQLLGIGHEVTPVLEQAVEMMKARLRAREIERPHELWHNCGLEGRPLRR